MPSPYTTQVYVIYDTLEKKFVCMSQARIAFHSELAAKQAFTHYKKWLYGAFDQQKRYVVKELTKSFKEE